MMSGGLLLCVYCKASLGGPVESRAFEKLNTSDRKQVWNSKRRSPLLKSGFFWWINVRMETRITGKFVAWYQRQQESIINKLLGVNERRCFGQRGDDDHWPLYRHIFFIGRPGI